MWAALNGVDAPDEFLPSERRAATIETNNRTLAAVRRAIMPHLTGWGLGF